MARTASVKRSTGEVDISVELDLDGGDVAADTGVAFFDHMLTQLGRHARLGLSVRAAGDTHVDAHHTVEDAGIALGQALTEALGDRAGVERFADAAVPIDEALARVALDLSGRPYVVRDVEWPLAVVGHGYESQLTSHFLEALATHAGLTLHVTLERADNGHHAHEAVFKAVAVALRRAVAVTGAGVPSTKGVLG